MIGRTNLNSLSKNFAFVYTTYHIGYTCIATNNVTTLIAPDTSGKCIFEIPDKGSFPQVWTFRVINNGEIITSKNIQISSFNQIEQINLGRRYLFQPNSDFGPDIPMTTTELEYYNNSIVYTINSATINSDSVIIDATGGSNIFSYYVTSNPIDCSLYTKITIKGRKISTTSGHVLMLNFYNGNQTTGKKIDFNTRVTLAELTSTVSETKTVSLENLTDNFGYISVDQWNGRKGELFELYLE